MKKFLTITVVAGLLCSTVQLAAEEEIHWTYSGETGPANWGALSEEFAACRVGKNQSPIDIRTDQLLEVRLPPINLDYQGETTSIINNGHTLQVNVSGSNTLTAEGEKFELSQFHFHSPSEHQIDGEAFPLEAHFVHKNSNGDIAVVGLLFQLGEKNEDLEILGVAAPGQVGETAPITHSLAQKLTMPIRHIKRYYRYSGSLTTPPCSEGLRWYVIPVAATISSEQIDNYIALIGKDARGPQPINARIVLHGTE
ncbi:MAG: carbonic anhydrase family protein [Halioglobus sp.]|jgi:carbonic anhydrase